MLCGVLFLRICRHILRSLRAKFRAFYNCSGLTSVTIGNSVTNIGDRTFYYCSGLTSVNYNGTKAQWNAIGKDSYWKYNSAIKKVVCTDGTITL